jgi:hypothetical protein
VWRDLWAAARGLAFWASLTYYLAMKTRPITVAETHSFVRAAAQIWSEEELAALVDHLAHNRRRHGIRGGNQGSGGLTAQ